MHGPWRWASLYPECGERNQSPVNILDEDALVSQEYQELTLEGFGLKSSNKTSMKNTGKTGKTVSEIYIVSIWPQCFFKDLKEMIIVDIEKLMFFFYFIYRTSVADIYCMENIILLEREEYKM